MRAFLTDGGFGAFTTNFEDLGGLRQLPGLAVQRLMADGYGFGGEGDWKTSVMLHTLKAMAPGRPDLVHGGLHLRPVRAPRGSSARTCSRSVRPSRRGGPGSRSIRWASATARTRSGWSSTRSPGRPWSSASATSATASGWWPTRSTVVDHPAAARTCRSPGPCGSRSRRWPPPPSAGWRPAARTTPCCPRAVGVEELTDFAAMVNTELALIDASTTPPRLPQRAALERGGVQAGAVADRAQCCP